MTPDKRYMTIEEVADLLGVTYQLIYRLVRAGEIPAVRIGRVYRIMANDLDEYLEKTKTSATTVGVTCAACGKTYHSELSVSEACRVCGAPICKDCWLRRGVTVCKEHEEAEEAGSRQEQGPSPAGRDA